MSSLALTSTVPANIPVINYLKHKPFFNKGNPTDTVTCSIKVYKKKAKSGRPAYQIPTTKT